GRTLPWCGLRRGKRRSGEPGPPVGRQALVESVSILGVVFVVVEGSERDPAEIPALLLDLAFEPVQLVEADVETLGVVVGDALEDEELADLDGLLKVLLVLVVGDEGLRLGGDELGI